MTITKKIIKKTAQLILLLLMVQLCFAEVVQFYGTDF